jgi:hypothetical protein
VLRSSTGLGKEGGTRGYAKGTPTAVGDSQSSPESEATGTAAGSSSPPYGASPVRLRRREEALWSRLDLVELRLTSASLEGAPLRRIDGSQRRRRAALGSAARGGAGCGAQGQRGG